MKNYFDFKISGRQIMWPLWGIMVASILLAALQLWVDEIYTTAEGEVVASGGYLLLSLLVAFVASFVPMLLTFPIVKATVEACGSEGEKVTTDYSFGRYVALVVKGSLLTIITLGIYSPWFLVKLTRFFVEGASYRLRPFGFHAKPMKLFVIVTLMLFVPIVVVAIGLALLVPDPAALSDVTVVLGALLGVIVSLALASLFCCVVTRWMINLSLGEERITSDIPLTQATLFIMGQLLLTVVTLGLYTPMMELRTMRYFAKCTRVGEGPEARKMGMTLRSWRDWAYVWGQLLLVVITLGIYMPWYYTRILNRFIPRIYVED